MMKRKKTTLKPVLFPIIYVLDILKSHSFICFPGLINEKVYKFNQLIK
jgi:hypothetical protein